MNKSLAKSPEEYLSGLEFDAEEPAGAGLNAAERAFVEKYLGYDTLAEMPVFNPEPVHLPMLKPLPEQPKPLRPKAPEIVVAKAPQEIIVLPAAPELIIAPDRTEVLEKEQALEKTVVETEVVASEATITEAPIEAVTASKAPQETVVELKSEAALKTVAEIAEEVAVEVEQAEASLTDLATEVAEIEQIATEELVETRQEVATEVAAPVAEVMAASVKPVVKRELSLRDRLRQEDEVQVVSFFVCGQIFLLPVIGIQEVLRYMELIRVPQAPPFIAGAMNLRGTVMPLVHLAAMVTNTTDWVYDEKSFIIVTGTEQMRIGLIIDKVSSMHMVPQNKFIWNAESKLADAAEFLSAIVDLDDRVCGMVSPEAITQKILSEF